jgi:hypothetical protein
MTKWGPSGSKSGKDPQRKKNDWPSANPGSGHSSQHKKIKPVKGSNPRNFPTFKVVNNKDGD